MGSQSAVEQDDWIVAWRLPCARRWLRRAPVMEFSRVQAGCRQSAIAAARHLMGDQSALFVVSREQVRRGLSALVPEKKQSDTRFQEAMLGWLPMVAPEFIVFSLLGGETHAHPARGACAKTALTAWSQCYHQHVPIACAPRKEWARLADWFENRALDVELSKSWASVLCAHAL